MIASRGVWLAMVLVVTGFFVAGTGTVQAGERAGVHGGLLRVDRDGDWGGGWFPLWFGFHLFAPRPPVIVEREYYPPPPPPRRRVRFYYFCRNPEGYYPQVPSCPGGWLRVLPSEDGPPR